MRDMFLKNIAKDIVVYEFMLPFGISIMFVSDPEIPLSQFS